MLTMAQFDENATIECLPVDVYKDLINALDKDSAWITLANHVAEQLQYPCALWVQTLKETKTPHDTPGERLLFELNIKMCTVEILRILLDDCGLYNVLSIIADSEPLQIITHPTEGIGTDILNISFGQHLRLICKAVGMPPPSYSWYHESRQLQRSTSQELDIIVDSVSQAGEYRCKVSQIKHNGILVSTLTSNAVRVQICSVPVKIEEQPHPILEVKEGEDFTIYCKAGGNPEPRYQWFQDNAKLESETTNVLHIKQFSSKHEGKYYCHIYNDVSEIYTDRSLVMTYLPRLKTVAKRALIIANGDYYTQEPLSTPANDGAYIATLLKEIGFEVICLKDLTIAQMKNAIQLFSKLLVGGAYGLFYYAGHGFKMQESYMLAVDAPEIYLRKNAICESELLASFLQNDPELLIVILDMCQVSPSKEFNSEIYNEVPIVTEYKSKKNLRNLLQAYSTSGHRPSYERLNSKYGLYMTHLGKYITKDIPITKLFEKVGKSIDSCFQGMERNQIPMFASSITKPFRLTDAVHKNNRPPDISDFDKLTLLPTTTSEVTFQTANICIKVTVSFMEPYLNVIKIHSINSQHLQINYFNSVPATRNNLYQDQKKNECWIHNPQINKGPLIISISKHGTHLSATKLYLQNYIPPLLKYINS
nr:mucosa-associated lymphoid tissue lymphoma translocation protein 1-like [Megalopta genalis]XP_033323622.1 mucosa-associated lymphoid tissue lymphoma translocation protein 1-like [Megalopta genalis]XP_033323623.1 mucosa-associated lymphoid tissue lymphoma translocation protein 1-like [Megalopta genalis]